MAAKPAKSSKNTKKPTASRGKATLKDLPSVKAEKIVGGLKQVDL